MTKTAPARLNFRDARTIRESFLSALLSALLTLAAAPATHAQTDYGRLVVIVLKQSLGSPAPRALERAKVTLTGERGARLECLTDAEGRCVFGGLEPGDYRIEAADVAGGRARAEFVDVTIRPGQRFTRSIVLSERAAIAAAVEVTPTPTPPLAPAPVAETFTPGRVGVNDTARTLEQLPNRDRRFAPVFDLLPGAFNSVTDSFSGVAFNGQPGAQNVLREDGVDTTPIVLSSASFQDTGALIFDVSKRQSFKKYKSFEVSTSNYPAELGTGTGAELIVNIGGGGKEHHGELYEFFADDALSARNFFDFARKPALRFNLFGFKLGGPLRLKGAGAPQLFYFVNYEGIRASSGNTLFEAAPSPAARARASEATAPLIDSFRAGGATVVAGASADPDFDTLRLDSVNKARKDSVTTRLDYAPGGRDTLGFLLIAAGSGENTPAGVTGRRQVKGDGAYTFAARHEHVFKQGDSGEKQLTNEFIFSVNSTPTHLRGRFPHSGGPDLSQSAVSVGGEVEQTGIPGQPLPLGVATPGALLAGSDFGGRDLRFTPRSFSFLDHLNRSTEKHNLSFGGEVRLVRASINQAFGATYNFASLADLLANRASVKYVGDLGSFGGAVGPRDAAQEYYIAYAQDEWNPTRGLRLAYGLRYEYYTALRESRDRAVVFDPAGGRFLPPGSPFYKSRKNDFLPRVSFAWAPAVNPDLGDINAGRTVFSASFGMYTGPDVFDNLLRPVVSDKISVGQEGAAFPADARALAASFAADADDRRFQPLAVSRDYTSPARVFKFDATLKRDLLAPAPDGGKEAGRELFLLISYVGSRSRGLLLRNFANPIIEVQTNPDPSLPAIVRRQFDVVRDGRVLSPFGEIEYLTTGGRARFDSLQLTLKGRAGKFLNYFEAQYTLARNYGNTNGDDKTVAAGNPRDFDYDLGYNAGDVRQKFSFGAVFGLDCSYKLCADRKSLFLRSLLGYWTLATIGNFQTGTPIDVRIKRPDVAYLDASGNVFTLPAAGRVAVLNVPGGGASVAAYRPDIIPGVNPYLGGFADRRFLNPAAFATPAPGSLGNLPRGFLRGPGVRLVDLSIRKEIPLGSETDGAKRLNLVVDVTNLFNFTNFKLPSATLPNKLGLDADSHQLQPGRPFTADAAGNFGVLTRTFKRQQDLGSSRQIQLSISFTF
jgi:hypothetical protein